MIKVCKICGKEFEPIKYGGKRIYCYECSPRGSIASQITSIRHSLKKVGIERLGGKCKHCGEDKIYLLDFHHRNPSEKEGELSDFSKGYNVEQFFLEIDKCDLLCANCHREFHYLNSKYNITYEDYLSNNFKV